jgi:aspartate/glutamate racemase
MVTIGLIHTTVNSIQPINDTFYDKYEGKVKLLNFLDEGILDKASVTGVTPEAKRNLVTLTERAVLAGAEGILLNCSIFTPFVDEIQAMFSVPVLSSDLAMLQYAVNRASHIAIIATVEKAGPTTDTILRELAKKSGKNISTDIFIRKEAFIYLKEGQGAKHDQIILDTIGKIDGQYELIILAQTSISPILKKLGATQSKVIASPEISSAALIEAIKRKFK